MKALITGIRVNEYTKNGEKRVAREVYVLKDKPKNPVDGLKGRPTEVIYVPFEIPEGVDEGIYCEFEYEIQQTRNGAMARLVDIIPIKPQILEVRELK